MKESIKDFLNSCFSGDQEIILAMLDSFIESEPKLEKKISEALGGDDVEALRVALHAYKGALALFGETEFMLEVKRAEALAKSKQRDLSIEAYLKAKSMRESFMSTVLGLQKGFKQGAA